MRLLLDNEYHIYGDGEFYGRSYSWAQARRLRKAYQRAFPGVEFEIREVSL